MAISIQVDKKTYDSIKAKGGKLTAAEYNQLLKNGNIQKNTGDKEKKHFEPFLFVAEFVKSDEFETVLIIKGRHARKNEIDSWPLRRKIQYKTALKEAVQLAKITYGKKLNHYKLVEFEYTVYNPKSRDDDANFNTLKILRDSIVLCGVIDDDKRKIVKDSRENEIISKEWKIEVRVLNCAQNCAQS